jgi:hypothetical protein
MDMGETEGPFTLEKGPITMKILRALKTHNANPIEISNSFFCGPMLLWCVVYMAMKCVDLLFK